jgi:hypothetical protein
VTGVEQYLLASLICSHIIHISLLLVCCLGVYHNVDQFSPGIRALPALLFPRSQNTDGCLTKHCWTCTSNCYSYTILRSGSSDVIVILEMDATLSPDSLDFLSSSPNLPLSTRHNYWQCPRHWSHRKRKKKNLNRLIYLREMIKRRSKGKREKGLYGPKHKGNQPAWSWKETTGQHHASCMHVGYRGPQVINYKREAAWFLLRKSMNLANLLQFHYLDPLWRDLCVFPCSRCRPKSYTNTVIS